MGKEKSALFSFQCLPITHEQQHTLKSLKLPSGQQSRSISVASNSHSPFRFCSPDHKTERALRQRPGRGNSPSLSRRPPEQPIYNNCWGPSEGRAEHMATSSASQKEKGFPESLRASREKKGEEERYLFTIVTPEKQTKTSCFLDQKSTVWQKSTRSQPWYGSSEGTNIMALCIRSIPFNLGMLFTDENTCASPNPTKKVVTVITASL